MNKQQQQQIPFSLEFRVSHTRAGFKTAFMRLQTCADLMHLDKKIRKVVEVDFASGGAPPKVSSVTLIKYS
jgi:hypothetical protein